MQSFKQWVWRWIAKRVVSTACRSAPIRQELENLVDARVRVQLLGPFELRRK